MSFVIPDYSRIFCLSKYCVRYSYILVIILPVLIMIFWFTRKTFVKFGNRFELEEYLKSKKTDRVIVLILRSLAIMFLMIAIASPFILTDRIVQGNPRITILVDNSTSMNLYNNNIASKLQKDLEKEIPVTVRTIATGDISPIGNGILNNIEGNDNVLVITDGSNNEGKLLGDIMVFAANINSTVSTLKMESVLSDASVSVEGPSEVIKDTEGDFIVKVNVAGKDVAYTIQVSYDDSQIIFEEKGSASKQFSLSRRFSEGEYHKITARLLDVGNNDYFKSNNVFYKSVKVVPRPKVLFISERPSPLANELTKIYELDVRNALPNDISDYMSVVLDDIRASKILPQFDMLNEYVIDGNGLIFIGGGNSFDRGSYKGTLLETLMPVKIGASEEQNKSDINVVLVIDISGGTEDYVALEKALALSVIDSLSDKNNVGAVAFNTQPYQIAEIKPLKENKKELREKISRLKFDGQSYFNLGIEGGYKLLEKVGGSKNIIFISDGKTTYNKLKESTLDAVRNVNAKGTKVFVVGVGTDTDTMASENSLFLDNIARLGEGIYFKVDASNKLKVQFGDRDEKKSDEFYNTLVPIDTTHFITLGMDDLAATISGYNYAVPKPSARLLITTQKNIPILVAWRFGLGRVVAFSTDDGLKWAGELLGKKNSKVYTRSINWVIGDLGRKKAYDVTIRDTALGRNADINVISKDIPASSGLAFAKIDTNYYSASYTPTETGYKDIMGATFATNYNAEYGNLGVNEEFLKFVEKTGGRVFDPNDLKTMLDFIKAKSKRIKIDSTDFRWPFAMAALAIFLLEIGLRKYRENLATR